MSKAAATKATEAPETPDGATAEAPETPDVDLSSQIRIERLGRAMCEIRIEGTAPLIINKFSEKARQQMEDKQQGKARQRQPKDPEALFQAARHILPASTSRPECDGYPATGFKAAIVAAARYFKGSGLTMTALKQMIFVRGEGSDMLVPLEAGEPKMRVDTVRNETGVADIRYRPEFDPWAATLQIVYVANMFDFSSLVALVDAAGMGGAGEWRPSSKKSQSGVYGTWTVPDQQPKIVLL